MTHPSFSLQRSWGREGQELGSVMTGSALSWGLGVCINPTLCHQQAVGGQASYFSSSSLSFPTTTHQLGYVTRAGHFLALYLRFPTRPCHNWLCHLRQAHLSVNGVLAFSMIMREAVQTIFKVRLGHSLGLA